MVDIFHHIFFNFIIIISMLIEQLRIFV